MSAWISNSADGASPLPWPLIEAAESGRANPDVSGSDLLDFAFSPECPAGLSLFLRQEADAFSQCKSLREFLRLRCPRLDSETLLRAIDEGTSGLQSRLLRSSVANPETARPRARGL